MINDERVYWNGVNKPGIVLLKEAITELKRPAEVKSIITNDWSDEHGTDRLLVGRYLASRKVSLPILVESETYTEYDDLFLNFQSWLFQAGYFKLRVDYLNRIYTLLYDGITDYREEGDFSVFTLHLLDDYPQIVEKIWP